MRGPLVPLEREPVSVHAPFVCYPGGEYRYEPVEERRAALLAAVNGRVLGAYDEWILTWLARCEVSTVAALVSLLWRAGHTAAQQTQRGGGGSR